MNKFRLYFDKDEETKWLNLMCMNGWAFTSFCLGVYHFEPCESGEYIYQIDLLSSWSGNKKDFAAFMEESGVEVLSQWYRWVFMRKKASEGPFEMYSDNESKIKQYARIRNFFAVVLVVEILCFLDELYFVMRMPTLALWGLVVLIGIIILAFLQIVLKCRWKIQQLRNEE